MPDAIRDQVMPDLLSELAAKLAALLIEEGLPRERAHALGRKAADFVRRDWGGQKIYIPMGQALDISERDQEIARRWHGRNTLEICREFGISEPHLRRIVAAVRKRHNGG